MSDRRRLVLVVGVGRSGTSLLTGILGQLGFHIPQPEVAADDTNPRGFSEPRWVVDFHTRLLRARAVTVNDSRPAAWEQTFAAAGDPRLVQEVRAWLTEQLSVGEAVVVKDPRTVWFLPLWTRVAEGLGVEPSFVTMLRHPPEVLASAVKSYGSWQPEASRAAAWVNVSLETERVTRDGRRAFVRYEDLLSDWRHEIERVGASLALPLITDGIAAERETAVDEFVDPTLHRNRVDWSDLDVPAPMQEVADRAWEQLQALTRGEGDLSALDATRQDFRRLHAEADALAHSTIAAVRRSGRKGARMTGAAPSLRVRIARRIPKRYRRRIRRLVGSRAR